MRDPRDIAASLATMLVLGALLYSVFVKVDRWAAMAFARPMMGSALVAVIDLTLFAIALCVAPILSRFVRRVLGRKG